MEHIDLIEQDIADINMTLLKTLLSDKTTGGFIRWCTDDYNDHGAMYRKEAEIQPCMVIGLNTKIVQPRVAKTIVEQQKRTKDKAEVFTPSWICNKQNNLVDEAWFGRKDVFNVADDQTWSATEGKVIFPEGKTWQEYVDKRVLEITCGEAPYLVSRYDTVTGSPIHIKQRVGLLDRKLRVVAENTETREDWLKWTMRAFEATYGFEYQGDNVLLARENLLATFEDCMVSVWGEQPSVTELRKVANIIAWNIWQMDGFSFTVPYSYSEAPQAEFTQESLFGESVEQVVQPQLLPVKCKIYDWRAKKPVVFESLIAERGPFYA